MINALYLYLIYGGDSLIEETESLSEAERLFMHHILRPKYREYKLKFQRNSGITTLKIACCDPFGYVITKDPECEVYAAVSGAEAYAKAPNCYAYAVVYGAEAYALSNSSCAIASAIGARAYASGQLAYAIACIKGARAYAAGEGARAYAKAPGTWAGIIQEVPFKNIPPSYKKGEGEGKAYADAFNSVAVSLEFGISSVFARAPGATARATSRGATGYATEDHATLELREGAAGDSSTLKAHIIVDGVEKSIKPMSREQNT